VLRLAQKDQLRKCVEELFARVSRADGNEDDLADPTELIDALDELISSPAEVRAGEQMARP
jgi:hypothetical protein